MDAGRDEKPQMVEEVDVEEEGVTAEGMNERRKKRHTIHQRRLRPAEKNSWKFLGTHILEAHKHLQCTLKNQWVRRKIMDQRITSSVRIVVDDC